MAGLLTSWVLALLHAIGWQAAPEWFALVVASLVASVLLFTVVLSIGGIFTFAFRRIFARLGQRRGPPPAKSDGLALPSSLYVSIVFTVLAWAAIPWSPDVAFFRGPTAILLILAMGAIAPLAEVMAGWGSNNKYALYGGVRAAALDVSYEIPMLIIVGAILLIVGSLDTVDITDAMAHVWTHPVAAAILLLPLLLGFVIFFITALAKAGLVPTDLAESESELVAGFTTEYSGMRFGMFFVVLFSNVFFVSAMITMLFLGGWHVPFETTLVAHGLGIVAS